MHVVGSRPLDLEAMMDHEPVMAPELTSLLAPEPGQTAVAATLNAEWAGSDVRVHTFFNYYRGDTEGDAALMMQRGIRKDEIGDHADVRDTSLLLATAPGMVRMDKLQAGDGKNGVVGDPRHASAEIGRALVEKTVTRTVKEIRESIAKR